MRKRIVEAHFAKPRGESDQDSLDLEQTGTVEVTSEDPIFII
jgi:hypothetical protein